jgi:phthiocerol/phenolphthiocerol synthesis type-I polyketide synthase C
MIPTRQKLSYLESRKDLVLRVESCDATSLEATSDLLRTFEKPLGGCFSLTLFLSDAIFMNQTEETFRGACDAKFKALQVFEAATSIEKLDFFVQFSSATVIIGNYGQSNYAV